MINKNIMSVINAVNAAAKVSRDMAEINRKMMMINASLPQFYEPLKLNPIKPRVTYVYQDSNLDTRTKIGY